MHVSAETLIAKIKRETEQLERTVADGASAEKIREHARLLRAYSELLAEGSETSVKAEPADADGPVSIHRPREEQEGSNNSRNLLEF
ncbi:DUF5327 family protein [Natribacillus halophilus]|uniref:Uncharacterized protein n=1 Tax=Natribacillus halophilus TaxID=549003 RepID=A0A1G8L0A0_9BACI|nr:DUF5327 family protein [Natribacillus halophilus]SDI49037.1 hypothetical protein SAMN04488123_102410 [Natribacillus halophilus]